VRTLALLGAVAALASGSVERGTIVPGRGVGPIEVGMTRARVVALLGEPLDTVGRSRLVYSRDNVFDVHLDGNGRVETITASGTRFCTRGGACLLHEGNVAQLRREFPGRVVKTQGFGRPLYTIVGTLGGRRVFTSFLGDRHAPQPTVLQVYVGRCRGGPCG
jgi:hypothetical protein